MKIRYALIILCFFSADLLAADIINDIENEFLINARLWSVRLQDAAEYILMALATISFTWTLIVLTLKGADLQEILIELVKIVMLVGFFLWVIRSSDAVIGWILNGWKDAANLASDSTIDLSASEVFSTGVDTGLNVVSMSDWDTFYVYAPAGLFILLLYVLLSIRILMATVEAYIVSAAGVILLGFAGSSWTLDYAKRYFIYAMSVGIKLYVVYLIVGLGGQFIDQVTTVGNEGEITYQQALEVLGMLLVIVYITYSIPTIVQGLLTGASLGNAGVGGIAQTMSQSAGKMAGAANTMARSVAAMVKGGAGATALAKKQLGGGLSSLEDAAKLPGSARGQSPIGSSATGVDSSSSGTAGLGMPIAGGSLPAGAVALKAAQNYGSALGQTGGQKFDDWVMGRSSGMNTLQQTAHNLDTANAGMDFNQSFAAAGQHSDGSGSINRGPSMHGSISGPTGQTGHSGNPSPIGASAAGTDAQADYQGDIGRGVGGGFTSTVDDAERTKAPTAASQQPVATTLSQPAGVSPGPSSTATASTGNTSTNIAESEGAERLQRVSDAARTGSPDDLPPDLNDSANNRLTSPAGSVQSSASAAGTAASYQDDVQRGVGGGNASTVDDAVRISQSAAPAITSSPAAAGSFPGSAVSGVSSSVQSALSVQPGGSSPIPDSSPATSSTASYQDDIGRGVGGGNASTVDDAARISGQNTPAAPITTGSGTAPGSAVSGVAGSVQPALSVQPGGSSPIPDSSTATSSAPSASYQDDVQRMKTAAEKAAWLQQQKTRYVSPARPVIKRT